MGLSITTLGLAAAISAPSADSAELRRETLMTALRAGGYTIVMRHSATDWSFQEDRTRIPPERSAQRNLTAEGVAQAKLAGAVLVRYQVPVGEILSSPMYRTRETAALVAGPATVTMVLRTFPTTPEQAALLAVAPPAGTNRLVVTHHFVIEAHVPGVRPGEVLEGEAVVIKPAGNGQVTMVGRITLADWEALTTPAGATGTTPAASYREQAASGHPTGATTAALPDTPVGRLARDYLQAFNSGDGATMRRFLEAGTANDPKRPIDDRVATYQRLFGDFGPLTVVSVQPETADQLVFQVTSKSGPLTMTVAAARETGRVRSITFARPGGGHR